MDHDVGLCCGCYKVVLPYVEGDDVGADGDGAHGGVTCTAFRVFAESTDSEGDCRKAVDGRSGSGDCVGTVDRLGCGRCKLERVICTGKSKVPTEGGSAVDVESGVEIDCPGDVET